MNEHDLMEALEDHAGDVLVGPAPIDVMTRSAGRTRRRRGAVGGLAAAAAVAVVTVGLVQVLPDRGGDGPDRVVEPAAADVPPAGSTYVGLGRAAIAVPSEWVRDDIECNGVPKHDTWTINLDMVVCGMASTFPAGTDIVTISGKPYDTTGWTPVEVDGEDALRSPDEEGAQVPDLGGDTVFGANIYLVDEGVTFRVESSVSAGNVARLLDTVVVLDADVAVPTFTEIGNGEDVRADEVYVQRLRELGLEVDLRPAIKAVPRQAGEIEFVDPAPGTVVPPGSTVLVRAAA